MNNIYRSINEIFSPRISGDMWSSNDKCQNIKVKKWNFRGNRKRGCYLKTQIL